MLFYRFISENLTSLPERTGTPRRQSDFDYAALSDADAEFGRAETVRKRASTSCPRSCSPMCGQRPGTTPTSTKPSAASLPTSKARPTARQRGRSQGPVRRSRRQQQQARPHRGQAQRKAGQAARRHRRPAAFGQRGNGGLPTTPSTCSATPTNT
jgi:hypothetical protein